VAKKLYIVFSLKVYGRGTSDNVQKVLWMAGETGQAFEHILAGGSLLAAIGCSTHSSASTRSWHPST
jgi:hypothetical protein